MTLQSSPIAHVILLGSIASAACGDVTAWTTPAGAPNPVIQTFSGNRYSVSLQSTYQAGTTKLNIRGDSNDTIIRIPIAVENDQQTWVKLHGDAGDDLPIGRVDSLITDVRGDANGSVHLINFVVNEMGDVSAHSFLDVIVKNVVRGPITLLEHPGFQGAIHSFVVQGDVTSSGGGDWNINGPVINLDVTGTFGQAAFPLTSVQKRS